MCLTCGCGDEDNVRVIALDDHGQSHEHGTDHHHHDHPADHEHRHGPQPTETLAIGEAILAKNDHLAEHNREWLAGRGITAINLMSSPGSGKTSLLERTITDLRGSRSISVIEGDQETRLDAERIQQAGARAVQVNTGAGCHLDAPMVQRALDALDPEPGSWVFIENVGNLVCPALFDIGEHAKVVVISVTEGDNKPLKYPHMFSTADLIVVNKTDLLPYVDFDVEVFTTYARSLNPDVLILPLSVRSGDRLDSWYEWLERPARQIDLIPQLAKPKKP